MNKLLIISYDIIRKGESEKSYAIASLLSYLKQDKNYKKKFLVDHLPINMFNLNNIKTFKEIEHLFSSHNFSEYNFIAISAYVWNEFLINDMIKYLRDKKRFTGKIILGGYQISYSSNLEQEYPDCQHFISGYAEKSLLDIVTNNTSEKLVNSQIIFNEVPSPYLMNELSIQQNQKAVRFETKRGCPYQCSFCAHRDLIDNKVYKRNLDKVFRELLLFKKKNVQKINIIDPIFNFGKEYIEVLKEMIKLNLKSRISIQTRFEAIKGKTGDLFLELCKDLNINLEFGLQTSNILESQIVNRRNNINHIKKVMNTLNSKAIDYEISLIYGLPTQTIKSFKDSINFVRENGCNKITAFPLMLLKGTSLYFQKDRYNIKERVIGNFNIPVVVSSKTFSENEWQEMRRIADNLKLNNRII